jgi:hypothetical protein
MFICPTCNKEFNTEQDIQKHFLLCWKEQHPYHQSKSAPRGENITTRKVNDDIMNFFEGLNNGRSIN